MQNSVKERLIEFYRFKGLTKSGFEQIVGLSNGYIDKLRNCPSSTKLESIYLKFPDLNHIWLLTGEGEMLKAHPERLDKSNGGNIPYYKEMPVSAGQAELMEVGEAENAVGFINITGVYGKYAFPVVGCSMEPVIHAGDIVVVDEVNRWDKIDPDKIYLIMTHEDRMIKHLESDEDNKDILWCVSPNYKRFSIMKDDILRIYRVTFYGRLV